MDSAVRVHRSLGPGLLESVYEVVLAEVMRGSGLDVVRQVPVRITFEGRKFDEGFRADLIVEQQIIVEIKSVEQLARVPRASCDISVRYLRARIFGCLRFEPAYEAGCGQ